ncbi:hypothetical protein [Staphylococcus epidermidis]|nr:hypothetical protein [Staphylococcus epidermidis]
MGRGGGMNGCLKDKVLWGVVIGGLCVGMRIGGGVKSLESG